MPSLESHEKIAKRNQTVIDFLLPELENRFVEFAPWIATIAFYKALHLIEGIFYMDGIISPQKRAIHAQNHNERNDMLRRNKKYENLWKHYRPLYEVSMVSRYLCDTQTSRECSDFDDYLKLYIGKSLQSKLLGHHLFQIQKMFDERKTNFVEKPQATK